MTTRVYLDHASSAPLRPTALEAMLPFLVEHHADPGRLHHEGRVTRVAIEQARESVAHVAGARPREVVFTSSGTEAINHAISGAVDAGDKRHVVTTGVEHSAVLERVRQSTDDVTVVGVDQRGRYEPAAVAEAIRADTALVSIQTANHEVGTLQPVAQTVAACRRREVLVHVDACASFGHLPLRFRELDADLCSITAHKAGGPKGVGALLIRRGLRIPSLVLGGAQERARRAGLENIPAIVGFGAICRELSGTLESEAAQASSLIDSAAAVIDAVAGVQRFGDPIERLPHILCMSAGDVEAEPILLALDQRGVAAHSGSSCSSEMLEPSPVLEAMGVDAAHSLRISVGWSSTAADVERFAAVFPGIVQQMRSLRGETRQGGSL